VPILALETRALMTWFGGILAARAWVDMGLLASPLDGKVKKDLRGARLAIDGLDALLSVLRGKVGLEETREMERTLADLRLNFVRQSDSGDSAGKNGDGEGTG